MEISIVDQCGSSGAGIRQFAERRIRFALSRFGSRILKVSLVMADGNGSQIGGSQIGGSQIGGSQIGADKVCHITVQMRGMADVVQSTTDTELHSCVARATDRIGRRVSRTFECGQLFDRRRPFVL